MNRSSIKGLLINSFLFVFLFSVASYPIVLSYLPGDEDYAAFAEEMPSPVGGMVSIQKHITYPSIAKQAGIEGKVFVLAYIDDKGNVDQVKVLKGIGAGCDEAALEAVKKSKFTPGKNKGVPLKVKLSLTINFKLS